MTSSTENTPDAPRHDAQPDETAREDSSQEIVPEKAAAAVETSTDEDNSNGKIMGRSKGKLAVIMAALCMAVFLAALDVTIITTALPTISQHFNSAAGYTWYG
jgi:hypothetical protein